MVVRLRHENALGRAKSCLDPSGTMSTLYRITAHRLFIYPSEKQREHDPARSCTEAHIVEAIQRISREGIPRQRRSRGYSSCGGFLAMSIFPTEIHDLALSSSPDRYGNISWASVTNSPGVPSPIAFFAAATSTLSGASAPAFGISDHVHDALRPRTTLPESLQATTFYRKHLVWPVCHQFGVLCPVEYVHQPCNVAIGIFRN